MGKGLAGLEGKERRPAPPLLHMNRRSAVPLPSGQQLLFVGQELSLLRSKLLSLTLDCKPSWVQAKAGQV